MRFDTETLASLRGPLMKRGVQLATILSEILAGKDKDRALDALGAGKPGMRPEERVRAALDQIDARRAMIDAGDDRYGRCDVCGADLGLPALRELPWADRCQAHAFD